MLTGETGIITQARLAREETEKGQIRDDVQREILEKMIEKQGEDLTAEELYGILDKYFVGVQKPGEEENNPWKAEGFPENFPPLQSREGNYTFELGELYSGNLSGTKTGGTGLKAGDIVAVPEGKKWDDAKVNPTVDEKGNVIPVPEGFYYVGGVESGTVGETKNIGVVISDVKDDDMENSKEGNEFVWVPVPTVVGQVDRDTEIDITTTPMAEEYSTESYRGILYKSWNFETKKVTAYASTANFKEPVTLSADPRLGMTDDLQAEYNTMIESVSTYGGFYVARYEMSLNGASAEYKKDKTSATALSSSADRWYGLYNKQKKFAANKANVGGGMIWGSQYDAMMNWMARCGTDVTARKEDSNISSTTGKVETDKINNIYDLYGNLREWTLESYNEDFGRTTRNNYGNAKGPCARNAMGNDMVRPERLSRRRLRFPCLTLYIVGLDAYNDAEGRVEQ